MDLLAQFLCCFKSTTILEDFILSKQGTSLVLPWPQEWRLTFHTIESIPDVSKEDIEEFRKTYLCCEDSLIIIGILHHVKKATCRGPLLLRGERGHLYVYNNSYDKCLYYVATNLQEFFLIGLKFFYPIYELCEFIIESESAHSIIEHAQSFSDILNYRNKNINVCFILKSHPYKTYVRFSKLTMTPYTEQDLINWEKVLECTNLDILFTVQYNTFGKWIEMILIFNDHGNLFAVDLDEKIIFIAHNLVEFLKVGCLRYNENHRLHQDCFTEPKNSLNLEEKFSRPVSCPWGSACKKKTSTVFKRFSQNWKNLFHDKSKR
ncbi:tegument protein UL43 [macacine betaherpesvirus 9]|uniref:Tegument protein UL43 n=1 Tax=macacine betaherpesvirus 9 TaxID=2560568 RepID=A0A192XP34_9BETA|nr:tegument protein UL43 [macacine betaherpesvirus 9]ANC96566.1 tegument protein UL43 [macacine betaherpesvirus 9]